jgi:hypothetical protein
VSIFSGVEFKAAPCSTVISSGSKICKEGLPFDAPGLSFSAFLRLSYILLILAPVLYQPQKHVFVNIQNEIVKIIFLVNRSDEVGALGELLNG